MSEKPGSAAPSEAGQGLSAEREKYLRKLIADYPDSCGAYPELLAEIERLRAAASSGPGLRDENADLRTAAFDELLRGKLEHTRSCPSLTPGNEEECRCGLVWRIRLQTEMVMHNAWRKRAEEAERAALAAHPEAPHFETGGLASALEWAKKVATRLQGDAHDGESLAEEYRRIERTLVEMWPFRTAPTPSGSEGLRELFEELNRYYVQRDDAPMANRITAILGATAVSQLAAIMEENR